MPQISMCCSSIEARAVVVAPGNVHPGNGEYVTTPLANRIIGTDAIGVGVTGPGSSELEHSFVLPSDGRIVVGGDAVENLKTTPRCLNGAALDSEPDGAAVCSLRAESPVSGAHLRAAQAVCCPQRSYQYW